MWTAKELFQRNFIKEMNESIEELHWLRNKLEKLDENSKEYRDLYAEERTENTRFVMLQKMHTMKCEYEAVKAELEALKATK